MRRNLTLGAISTILAISTACGDDTASNTGWPTAFSETGETEESTPAPVCHEDEEQPCECDNGWTGTRPCLADGSGFGECSECSDPNPVVCGDGFCDPDENCWSCEADCGICLDCNAAPNCEGAAIPGVIDTHLEELDVPAAGAAEAPLELAAAVHDGTPGMRIVAAALDEPRADEPPLIPALRDVFTQFPNEAAIVRRQLERAGMDSPAAYRTRFPEHELIQELAVTPQPSADGATNCEPAKLRIRVAKIKVINAFDGVSKDKVYCAIVTEAAATSEIRVTPTTSKLASGQEYVYALAEGVVWGQLGEPVAPLGNLLVTYNCLESDDTSGFQKFLQAIGDAALGATPIPSAYGWVIPVTGLAAEIIAAALALETDDHLFNASQIIPAELQLEMTNGVWWSVQRKGKQSLKKWHWDLHMEAWGCTDDGVIEEVPPTE